MEYPLNPLLNSKMLHSSSKNPSSFDCQGDCSAHELNSTRMLRSSTSLKSQKHNNIPSPSLDNGQAHRLLSSNSSSFNLITNRNHIHDNPIVNSTPSLPISLINANLNSLSAKPPTIEPSLVKINQVNGVLTPISAGSIFSEKTQKPQSSKAKVKNKNTQSRIKTKSACARCKNDHVACIGGRPCKVRILSLPLLS